jgi:RNA polymerase sigma-70 factor (ECF subfamily)
MTAGDDDDRIERARRGDAAALGELWRAHRDWVAAVLFVHAPRRDDLEDLLQEVALALVARIGDLASPGAFRAWLRAIALNTARSAGRRVRARPRLAPLPDIDALPDPDAERRARSMAAGAAVAAVMDTLAHLPLELREPLVLRCVHGLSQRAIAAALEVPETTVETRLARARRLLRRDHRGAQPVLARERRATR